MENLTINMGILTQPLKNSQVKSFKEHIPTSKDIYKTEHFQSNDFLSQVSFYESNYSSWLSSANINSIPILINIDKNKIISLLKKLNGILFPGGATKMFELETGKPTLYLEIVRFIMEYAKKENDNGRYFLIWGICLGHESVMNSLNMKQNLKLVNNQKKDYMKFYKKVKVSQLEEFIGKGYFDEEIFYFFNKFAFDLKDFLNNDHFVQETDYFCTIKNEFSEFVTYIEFKNYPFYLPLFHTEKNKEISDEKLEKKRKELKLKIAEFIKFKILKNSKNFSKIKKELIAKKFNKDYTFSKKNPECFFFPENF